MFSEFEHFKISNKSQNIFANMFIYTETTLDFIETLEISIYNPPKKQNTKTHVIVANSPRPLTIINLINKKALKQKQSFVLICME